MSEKLKKVAVVGGGVVGLTCAVNLIEKEPELDITLIASKLSPETTGDVSAGMWFPYLLGDVPLERMNSWCTQSFEYFLDLYNSPIASEVGVSLISMYTLTDEEINESVMQIAHCLINYRKLKPEEILRYSTKYKYGYFVTTIYIECIKFLPFLLRKFHEKGGKLRVMHVNKLDDLAGEFRLLINCTGLGSYVLESDKKLTPIRGQVMRGNCYMKIVHSLRQFSTVKAPWIKHSILTGNHYIIPNTDSVILGGTKQANDWNLNLSRKDQLDIRKGCERLMPNLKTAKVMAEQVDLRPGRDAPRLEKEKRRFGNVEYDVIHNYGHGGCGVTLSWGCAQEVLSLTREWMRDNFRTVDSPLVRSKL